MALCNISASICDRPVGDEDTQSGCLHGTGNETSSGRDAFTARDAHSSRSDWLRTTDVLKRIVEGGSVRATVEINCNIIKAMNNLMCSETFRVSFAGKDQLMKLFELTKGYTHEVRCPAMKGLDQRLNRVRGIMDVTTGLRRRKNAEKDLYYAHARPFSS